MAHGGGLVVGEFAAKVDLAVAAAHLALRGTIPGGCGMLVGVGKHRNTSGGYVVLKSTLLCSERLEVVETHLSSAFGMFVRLIRVNHLHKCMKAGR